MKLFKDEGCVTVHACVRACVRVWCSDASCPTCPLCHRYPCCVHETFLAETCKVEADAWFLYFYPVQECEFAEIKEVGVDCGKCAPLTPASRILRLDIVATKLSPVN